MKKLIFAALCVAAFAFPARAQSIVESVYLKNGSIIRGVIVEQVPSESLKIQTRDGNLFVYRMDEIAKIVKESAPRYRSSNARTSGFGSREFNKPSGYMGLVEIGGGVGVGDWNADRLSISMVNGYRFIPQFALGLGVGIQGYFNYGSEWTLPIFVHLRSDLIDGPVSPFVALNVGYNISLAEDVFRGIMVEPTVGVSFNLGPRHRMTVGLSYAVDRIRAEGQYYDYIGHYGYGDNGYGYDGYEQHYTPYTYTLKDYGSAIKLRVGFSF